MKQAAVTVEVNGLQLRAGATASGRVLCSNLELAVNAGECWVVLGPNGAGKSTLIATLAGLLPVSAGRIALQGRQRFMLSVGALVARRVRLSPGEQPNRLSGQMRLPF